MMPLHRIDHQVVCKDARLVAIDRALRGLGTSWSELCDAAQEIVLFGSRACGCADEASDWDLLCIGAGRQRLTRAVDLIWLPAARVATPAWMESELAGHISTYGHWLHSTCSWQAVLRPGPSLATEAKAARIARVVASLERVWDWYSLPYRVKHWRRLRRDLQRYELLWRGQAVTPTAWLDQAWHKVGDKPGECMRLYRALGDLGDYNGFFAHLVEEMAGVT